MIEINPNAGDVLLDNPPTRLQSQNASICVGTQCVNCKQAAECVIAATLYRRHWHKQIILAGHWMIPWIEKEGKCTHYAPSGKPKPARRSIIEETQAWLSAN